MSDLISREALYEATKDTTDVSYMAAMILCAPSVDAVEVVHAEWINRPKTCVFVCSACKREVRTFHTNSVEEAESEFPYCHCGAKMDERRESEVSE